MLVFSCTYDWLSALVTSSYTFSSIPYNLLWNYHLSTDSNDLGPLLTGKCVGKSCDQTRNSHKV